MMVLPTCNANGERDHWLDEARKRNWLPAVVTVLAVSVSLAVRPYAATAQYHPTIGQDGKDVIWGPTPEVLVEAMLDMARVSPGDYLIDLGSGDGRIVIAAAKRGARALGIEYNPDLVKFSRARAQKEGVSDRVDFIQADIFEADFSRATVLTMYLLTHLNLRLRPKILKMQPGTRVVSHGSAMDDWEPDQSVRAAGRTAYFWTVPANVAGNWGWQSGSGRAELSLYQSFQKVKGSLVIGGKKQPRIDAKLEGDRLSFTGGKGRSGRWEYSGRLNGNAIEGVARNSQGAEVRWVAERLADQ